MIWMLPCPEIMPEKLVSKQSVVPSSVIFSLLWALNLAAAVCVV